MGFYSFKRKLEEKEIYKDKMLKNLLSLEKFVNSELTSKIQNSVVENDELLVETGVESLIDVIQFLKSNDNCKFKGNIYFKSS